MKSIPSTRVLLIILIFLLLSSAHPNSIKVHREARFQKIMQTIEHERESWNPGIPLPSCVDSRLTLAMSLLGTPYAANTMIGSYTKNEELVLRADSLDCMTFLDLLLAAEKVREGWNPEVAMIHQRYFEAHPTYENRHHFFTNWISSGPHLVDAGVTFLGAELQQITLNARDADKQWLEGIALREQLFYWVPKSDRALENFQSGDFIGFRSNLNGLDVTHLGVIIAEKGRVDLIHASSVAGHVVREALAEISGWKKGVVVLRSEE